ADTYRDGGGSGELEERVELEAGHGYSAQFGIGRDPVHRERDVGDVVGLCSEVEEHDRRGILLVEREHGEDRFGGGLCRDVVAQVDDGGGDLIFRVAAADEGKRLAIV